MNWIRSLVFWLLLFPTAARAAQVSWSTEANATDLDSQGQPFHSGYIFELGAFAPGFTPTQANTAQWVANWTTAARAAYDPVNRAVSGPRYVYSTNTTPFLPSNRGWIWGYRSGRPAEWILMGNPAWLWPDASSPFSLPVIWGTVDATQAVVGSLRVGPVQMRSSPVVGAAVPPLTYAAWRATYFTTTEQSAPPVSGADADPDGDRIPNSVEYLTGTAPRQANTLPVTILGPQGIEITLPAGRTGTLVAQVSANLQFWQSGTALLATPLGDAFRFYPATPQNFPGRAFWRFSGSIP